MAQLFSKEEMRKRLSNYLSSKWAHNYEHMRILLDETNSEIILEEKDNTGTQQESYPLSSLSQKEKETLKRILESVINYRLK